jgi:hypothetical protein
MDKRHEQRQAHVQWPGITYNRALSKAIYNVSISIQLRMNRCTYGAEGPCRSLSTSACEYTVRTICFDSNRMMPCRIPSSTGSGG